VLKPEGSRKVPAAPRRTQDRGPLRGHKHQLLSRRRQLSRHLCNLQSSEEGFQRDSTKAARASRESQTPRSRANGFVRRQLTVRLVDLILHHWKMSPANSILHDTDCRDLHEQEGQTCNIAVWKKFSCYGSFSIRRLLITSLVGIVLMDCWYYFLNQRLVLRGSVLVWVDMTSNTFLDILRVHQWKSQITY
jgi:hypothetical protein